MTKEDEVKEWVRGEIRKCHKHEWVRSNFTYTSIPAQWDEICKSCGLIERRHDAYVSREETFDEINERINGEKK